MAANAGVLSLLLYLNLRHANLNLLVLLIRDCSVLEVDYV